MATAAVIVAIQTGLCWPEWFDRGWLSSWLTGRNWPIHAGGCCSRARAPARPPVQTPMPRTPSLLIHMDRYTRFVEDRRRLCTYYISCFSACRFICITMQGSRLCVAAARTRARTHMRTCTCMHARVRVRAHVIARVRLYQCVHVSCVRSSASRKNVLCSKNTSSKCNRLRLQCDLKCAYLMFGPW